RELRILDPEEGLVFRAGAEAEQLGLVEIRRRDEYARRERRRDLDVAGQALERADDRELGLADRDRIADRGVEGDEQRRVDDRVASVVQRLPAAGRIRLDGPVEREAGLDGADLHEPRRAASGMPRHRRERRDARDANAFGGELVEQLAAARTERLAARQLHVRAEHRPGLLADLA